MNALVNRYNYRKKHTVCLSFSQRFVDFKRIIHQFVPIGIGPQRCVYDDG